MLTELAHWLDGTVLASAMRETFWVVPMTQTVHILAIAIVFSASVILALSTFGYFGEGWPYARWGKRLKRWTVWGIGVLFLSGILMVTGEPERSLLNLMFQIKMVLLVVALLLFWQLNKRIDALGNGPLLSIPLSTRLLTRLLGLSILTCWIAIISAGRWIAYYIG